MTTPGKNVPTWWTNRHQIISDALADSYVVANVPAPPLDKWWRIVRVWADDTVTIPEQALKASIDSARTLSHRTKIIEPQHALNAWRDVIRDRTAGFSGKSEEESREECRLHELNVHYAFRDNPDFRASLRGYLMSDTPSMIWKIPVPGIWHNPDAKVKDIKAACDSAGMQKYYRWLYGVLT